MTEKSKSDHKKNLLDTLCDQLNRQELKELSPHATMSKSAVRRKKEDHHNYGYRQSFSLDTDRILHSLAYTRYIDKTQVFSLIKNDHITHRVLHVQLVSKIARTIGRFLKLNEDLIEAIALGHDIGHTPFGHDGEHYLSSICVANGIGCFLHNVQSIQFLDQVERKGHGWNLTLQVLDGILCHDGEIHSRFLAADQDKNFNILSDIMAQKKENPKLALMPMTLEGCVVRMADTVAYIGRDLEDAIRLNLIKRSDIPEKIVKVIGDTNGTIVFNLVTDILENSFQQAHVAFSQQVSEALENLKHFNLEHIYLNPKIKRNASLVKNLFEYLFDKYLSDIVQGDESSKIFRGFMQNMSDGYIGKHKPAEIVRDFIAGMTDRYFLLQCPENMQPKPMEF
jgi:dGTPase